MNGVLRRGTFEINMVYRRLGVQEFLIRFDLTHPLVQAYRDRAVCVVNSFRSELAHKKAMFGLLTDENGRERPLTQSSFSSFLVKRDHELRKRAFHQFYAEFQDHQYTLAASLAYSVKADVFRARARNYSSALEAALFPDDVPVGVYNGLIKSVRANKVNLADAFAPDLVRELTDEAPRWAGDVTRGEWSARVRADLSTPNGDVLPAAARRPELPATPPPGSIADA